MLPRMSQYDYTPELRDKIQAEIRRRLPDLSCPLCHRKIFTMVEGFVTVPILRNVWTNDRMSGLPSAVLVCDICGHTLFFNVGTLGFSESIGPDMKKLLE